MKFGTTSSNRCGSCGRSEFDLPLQSGSADTQVRVASAPASRTQLQRRTQGISLAVRGTNFGAQTTDQGAQLEVLAGTPLPDEQRQHVQVVPHAGQTLGNAIKFTAHGRLEPFRLAGAVTGRAIPGTRCAARRRSRRPPNAPAPLVPRGSRPGTTTA